MFRSSFGNKEEFDYACSIKEETVVLRFGTAQGGMFQLNSTNVGVALKDKIQEDDIIALWCLRGNHTWHATLATRGVTDALLEVDAIRVKGPNGATRCAYLELLIPRQVSVRVLWCPAWVPSEVVFELLTSIAEVQDFDRCRSRVGEFNIPYLQYTAILKGISPAQVPDHFTLEIFEEKVPILLITTGKPRCCFLCGSCAHTQSSCPNPICRYCNKRGHFTSNCPKRIQPVPAFNPNKAKASASTQSSASKQPPANTKSSASNVSTEPSNASTEPSNSSTEPSNASTQPSTASTQQSLESTPGPTTPNSQTEGKSLNRDKRPYPGDEDEATSNKIQAIPETQEPDLLSPLIMETGEKDD